jgi:hypothetical protein
MNAVLIIGGGYSVSSLNLSRFRSMDTIAINNSWEIAPWAGTLLFGDSRWWDKDLYGVEWGNREKVLEFFGGEIITTARVDHPRVTRMKKARRMDQFLRNPEWLFGTDSGTKALSLSYRRGYKRIYVAGFDGGKAGPNGEHNFHNDHKTTPNTADYHLFLKNQEEMIDLLEKSGAKVFRITEGGLSRAPYLKPEDLATEAGIEYNS